MVVGNIGQITSMAIRLANSTIGTSIPVLSTEQIDYLMVSIPYLTAAASVGAGKVRNTIDNFRNRSRRPGLETEPTFKKSKQEQERKRQLWNEQQGARLNKKKPRFLEKTLRKEYQRRLAPSKPVQAFKKATEEIEGRTGDTSSISRRPEAVLARLRAQRLQELKAKRVAETVPGGEVIAETEELKQTAQRLKNIYRVINGTSAITVIGLIITISTMNSQLIFGNLLKVNLPPKLSLLEIIVIIFLDLLILFSLLILFVLIYVILHPGEIIKQTLL